MAWPTIETFDRPDDLGDREDPNVLYARAFLRLRLVIGLLGMSLPLVLLGAEKAFVDGPWHVRESFSAYYHHGVAGDIFVGVLTVTGLFLIAYIAGRLWSWDYILSSFAGLMALGVAFFPTLRPGVLDEHGDLIPGAQGCGTGSELISCTPLQEKYGELRVGDWHGKFALAFIGGLALICFLTAFREWKHRREAENVGSRGHPKWHERFHLACGAAMAGAGAWVVLDQTISVASWNLTAVYVAEFLSVIAFGLSWIVRGFDLVPQVVTEIKEAIL